MVWYGRHTGRRDTEFHHEVDSGGVGVFVLPSLIFFVGPFQMVGFKVLLKTLCCGTSQITGLLNQCMVGSNALSAPHRYSVNFQGNVNLCCGFRVEYWLL